jgi:gamma-glutamyltranspeptidase/glutathione hydrolase
MTQKLPATGSWGMVATNHPLASAAGVEMLAGGGNAADAAVAALFTLTVVEPMMVGLLGGGMSHIRTPDGRHVVLDGLASAPALAQADQFQPLPGAAALETVGNRNAVGAGAVASAGAVAGWCALLEQYGTMALADVMAPAIRHAQRGFRVTAYLSECTGVCAADLARDKGMAALFLPGGAVVKPGDLLVQAEAADSLRAIAAEGPGALHGGALGRTVSDFIATEGGTLRLDDLAGYMVRERAPVRGTYRGHEIVAPPPPASSGVHIIQMLNILEGFDIGAMPHDGAARLHLLAEALKIAFADRAAATADPDFVAVPVEAIVDKTYAEARRDAIDPLRAQAWQAGVQPRGEAHTTHLTVADRSGLAIASTQTINSLFGARIMAPGTGMIANNNMFLFDPRPGRALSIAPGKRVTTSQSPTFVLRDGRPLYALGLPGGLRIFGAVMQAIVNLIDHRMTLQQTVDAPRLWTNGGPLELEPGYAGAADGLRALGHDVLPVRAVGGGMNGIAFMPDGALLGAACWRADGAPIGLGGGHAAAGVRFNPDAA